MIEIADRLRLIDEKVSKSALVESAKQKWHLPAAFTWGVSGGDTLIPMDSPPSARTGIRSPYDRAALAAARKSHACVHCRTYLSTRCVPTSSSTSPNNICESCESRLLRQVVSIPRAWPLRAEQLPTHDIAPQFSISTPLCRRCGIILPEGITDGLCYVCTCPDPPFFDQEPDWLWTGVSSYPQAVVSYMSPSEPSSIEWFHTDASDSLLQNFPIGQENDTSGFQVNLMEPFTSEITAPGMGLPFCDDPGLNGRIAWLDDSVVSCEHISHGNGSEIIAGYLV
jgi:hypothetical protein